MADGLLGKCKDCTNADVAERRLLKLDDIRAYDRERAKLPYVKARVARCTRAWRLRFPERFKTHCALNNAIRGGHITRPFVCSRCPANGRIEAHHHDYSRPLDVEWLCKPCHAKADAERRAQEAA